MSETIGAPAQRIEVFTGAGRRRSWTVEQKASIVAESYAEGENACQVARRHGLTPQQLFTWRREARRLLESGPSPGSSTPPFVPAIIETPARHAAARSRNRGAMTSAVSIELEIGGVTVRVGRNAEAETIAAVIRALKAGA